MKKLRLCIVLSSFILILVTLFPVEHKEITRETNRGFLISFGSGVLVIVAKLLSNRENNNSFHEKKLK